MKYQRGMSLSNLLMAGVVLFLVALLGMKVSPAWIEYGKIKKAVSSVAKKVDASQGVQQVYTAFEKQAELDIITAITAQDLEITKEGSELVISFAYTAKVPLMSNASLVFDFAGTSKGKSGSE